MIDLQLDDRGTSIQQNFVSDFGEDMEVFFGNFNNLENKIKERPKVEHALVNRMITFNTRKKECT
jgi:hypothetical protein